MKNKNYNEFVAYLESLQMMPKSMPGLEKIKKALDLTDWYPNINPEKVIVIAGTNGKGTTAAALESMLIGAGFKVGLYTSPHLISTTERIRLNGKIISDDLFLEVGLKLEPLIKKCQLSHFESLTLMAGHIFFQMNDLDFSIFEVGLGGLFDATNAYPHQFSVITKIGLDHQNILGYSLVEIAKNKLGIIHKNNTVFHHQVQPELKSEFNKAIEKSHSTVIPLDKVTSQFHYTNDSEFPVWSVVFNKEVYPINLMGERAVENIQTAMTVFNHIARKFNLNQILVKQAYSKLNHIFWRGRLEKIYITSVNYPVLISGDHNEQGMKSLFSILKFFKTKTFHLIIGFGHDKEMKFLADWIKEFEAETKVQINLHLTRTPFKGRSLSEYPNDLIQLAKIKNENIIQLLNEIVPKKDELVLITGSLYLVGKVLEFEKK